MVRGLFAVQYRPAVHDQMCFKLNGGWTPPHPQEGPGQAEDIYSSHHTN